MHRRVARFSEDFWLKSTAGIADIVRDFCICGNRSATKYPRGSSRSCIMRDVSTEEATLATKTSIEGLNLSEFSSTIDHWPRFAQMRFGWRQR